MIPMTAVKPYFRLSARRRVVHRPAGGRPNGDRRPWRGIHQVVFSFFAMRPRRPNANDLQGRVSADKPRVDDPDTIGVLDLRSLEEQLGVPDSGAIGDGVSYQGRFRGFAFVLAWIDDHGLIDAQDTARAGDGGDRLSGRENKTQHLVWPQPSRGQHSTA